MEPELEPTQLEDFPPAPPDYTQSSRKGGYSVLNENPLDPHIGYSTSTIQPSAYAPAPPVFQQQSSSMNVVVVCDQPAAPTSVVHVSPPRANDYFYLTAIMILLCFLHGNLPALIMFLIPAMLCSCVAQAHNRSGDYESANSCGYAALCCNVFAMIYFVILIIVGVAVVAVYFTSDGHL